MFDAVGNYNKPLAERVAGQIEQKIINSSLQAGEKLPNEFELAESLHVGRGTVREAVKILVSRNVLEIHRGKGTFVAQRPGIADDPLGLAFYHNKRQLAIDLLELRFMIEPEIAAMAAERATPGDIEEMRRLCGEIENFIAEGKDYGEIDKELHTCIAKSTRNQVLPDLLPMINQAIGLFIDLTNQELRRETIETHREIVHSIANKDAAAAKKAMLRHLRFNEKSLLKRTSTEPE